MTNYKNIFIFIGILIIVFIAISYLKVENLKEQQTNTGIVAQKPCTETCKTESCLYGCYTTLINVAIAEGNLEKCNEIKTNEIEQSCLDQVNLVLKNCDKISNEGLRNLCLG